jgi:cardiolipin synthase
MPGFRAFPLRKDAEMSLRWITGNRFSLLENGEQYFPRVFEVIAGAQREVLLETFIVSDDKVGQGLHAALLAAAKRGAQVDVTIDGYGSADLPGEFLGTLTAAGVRVHVFDPAQKLFGWRTNLYRRMHRKLVVVDGQRAFVGGINYSADHLADFGPKAKQDYAVEIEGPIVSAIHGFMQNALADGQPGRRWFRRRPPAPPSLPASGPAEAMFVWRDNRGHTNDIERHYRLALRLAQRRLVIANAYFFPGYTLLKELRKAARRGVEVSLILQGNPDMPFVQTAASMLYHSLLRSGVRIFEYCDRPLHAKVALVDDIWSTVGSSNLDPLSLSLNLEANVMIRDREFARNLDQHLSHLIKYSCQEIREQDLKESSLWRIVRGYFLFHVLRRYPAWAGWLPAHVPRLVLAASPPLPEGADRLTGKAGP